MEDQDVELCLSQIETISDSLLDRQAIQIEVTSELVNESITPEPSELLSLSEGRRQGHENAGTTFILNRDDGLLPGQPKPLTIAAAIRSQHLQRSASPTMTMRKVSRIFQACKALTAEYGSFLEIDGISSSWHNIPVGLTIESRRLALWADYMFGERGEQNSLSEENVGLWTVVDVVLMQMQEAFKEVDIVFGYELQQDGPTIDASTSGRNLLEKTSPAHSPPRLTSRLISQTLKFVKDNKKMETLIERLKYWNDSLDKMVSRLEQESSRRRLRIYLSTSNTTQLQHLSAAAAVSNYPDIESMASVRSIIEQDNRSEESQGSSEWQSGLSIPISDYQLKTSQILFPKKFGIRAMEIHDMAIYGQENIIIDWQSCKDNTWRLENPIAFRRRTTNLTKVLNSDLRPLGMSILHCVGYFDLNSLTGYAFRLPPDALPAQEPVTLEQLLRKSSAEGIPSLDERFKLAQALTSTMFNIHNLGWLHRDIQPKNILFWPKPNTKKEMNISKPYLIGFDISVPYQLGEQSEKTIPFAEDEVYRHPANKGIDPHPFRPSFDMYSLGVILYEIGMWRNVTSQSNSRDSRSNPDFDDPNYIEKTILSGPITQLKRYTGRRYQNAVMACLSQELDSDQKEHSGDRQVELQEYLEQVQSKVVDVIAVCCA